MDSIQAYLGSKGELLKLLQCRNFVLEGLVTYFSHMVGYESPYGELAELQLGYRDLFAAIFPAGDGGEPVIERENSEEFSQIPVDIPQKNEHGEESDGTLKEHYDWDCSEDLLCLQSDYEDCSETIQKTGNWVEEWELTKCKDDHRGLLSNDQKI